MISKIKHSLLALGFLIASVGIAAGQSNPGLFFGQVPTPGQWNSYFANKIDYTGQAPCFVIGCTFTGKVTLPASTTSGAPLNIPHGSTPSSPVNGDVWTTTSGVFAQINGVTVGPFGTGGGGGAAGSQYAVQYNAGSSMFAGLGPCSTTTLVHGQGASAPTCAQVNLAADVTGNLPTGNLAGGSGANSTTFWRGDGIWATPSTTSANINPPQGRLTLTSGTPIMQATVAGATNLFYAPAIGNQIPIYNGSVFAMTTFAQLTNVTTDTTVNPAAVVASSVYDLFVWNNGGTMTLSRGPAWFSDTSRCSGGEPCAGGTEPTDPQLVNGIALNRNSITNGPAGNRGTWVGTIRSNGTATIDMNFGGRGAGGVAGFLGVYNFYNQVQSTAITSDSNNYSYTSSTPRPWDNSTGNRITFVRGANDNGISIFAQQELVFNAVAGAAATSGWCLDCTAGFSQAAICLQQASFTQICTNPLNQLFRSAGYGAGFTVSTFGVHYVQGVEQGDNVNPASYSGSNSIFYYLSVSVWN